MQQQNLPNIEEKLEYLERDLLSCENYTEEQTKDIKHKFSYIKSEFKLRWLKAHKKEDVFLKKNSNWLQGAFSIPKVQQKLSAGRPKKPFIESSERTKRRKTKELRSAINEDVLLHAAQSTLRTSGKRDASQLLKEIIKSPKRATRYKKVYSESMKGDETKLTPSKALSIFIEADLTRRQYEIIRSPMKKKYPSYSVLQRAKQDCYPPNESFQVTETSAETQLQDLMNHTVKRLLIYLGDILEGLSPKERSSLELICKWGCDGSQQAEYKQKMQTDDASDANVFQSCFVPLKLVCGTKGNKVVWLNPTPSSPRYCRPMRIRFVKESVDITNAEIDYFENAIKLLQNTEYIQGEKTFSVKHTMMLTMVDAKVCNAATGTASTMRCYICGATSKKFNDLTIKCDIDTDALSFGLSVLHARIRFLESILHLSYKLPVQKWQLRSENDKAIVKQRKAEIQEKFRHETGLIVDVPKSGFGNTNDGNTSRRFFANPELAAQITGVDYNLIYRLKVILEVISSGHKVDFNKFAEYGIQTARLYVEMYPWHPMTPTLHKILVHGATVIQHALLPIGLLSEEAAEARNKHFRQYRQNFARKFSRELCNRDVLNRLLLSSDPLVSSLRPTRKKKMNPFSKEAMEMLIPAEPNPISDDSDSTEKSTEDAEESTEDKEESSDEE